jgi:asparagine synthase (glutamine-hydrolysing)
MCGIAVAIGEHLDSNEQCVRRILARLASRGDSAFANELFAGEGYCLGANRMAINSTAEQRQPEKSNCGQIVVVLNGEIYNLLTLAARWGVDAAAVRKRRSDTGLLSELLAIAGPDVVCEFDGMFALAWVHTSSASLFVARDEWGIKPGYWGRGHGGLRVASEIKGLAAEPDIREIHEIEPGSVVEIGLRSGRRLRRLAFPNEQTNASDDGCTPEALRVALMAAIRDQTCDQRSVGVLLSGGLDSSWILAGARQFTQSVVGVCVEGPSGSDGPSARALGVELCTAVHVEQCPSEERLFDDVAETIRIVESFEPNVVRQSSVSRIISNAAKSTGLRVFLCGEGADELFCGYPELTTASDWTGMRSAFLRDLRRTQLQRVDRTSMADTLEVRVPFLSRRVVSMALGTSDPACFFGPQRGATTGKHVLREAACGLLPSFARWRPKTVLSEGAGLRGNHPTEGMFSQLVQSCVSEGEFEELRQAYPDWSLRSREDAFYFSYFLRYGYDKASFMKARVVANAVDTVNERVIG